MQTSTLLCSALIGISLLIMMTQTQSNSGNHQFASGTQADQSNDTGPWFQAAPMMQVVNETPKVIDTRTVPEPPPVVVLPPPPWMKQMCSTQPAPSRIRTVRSTALIARNTRAFCTKSAEARLSYTQCHAKLLSASAPDNRSNEQPASSVSLRLLHRLSVREDADGSIL
jgi:hypothetical protein